MPLLRDLIELPEHVTRGDFVMRLSEGVTRGQDTVADYVVTEQLALCFDAALTLVKTALQTRSSRGSYLHGSFGSGKSHFMAVLHLLLGGDLRARAKPELASTIAKHDEWMSGKKFLLVPYHLVGADNVESAVLGGYVAHIAKLHPESAPPAVYPSQELLANAETLRTAMGDAAFFGRLNTDNAAAGGGGWGKLRAGWDASSYEAAAGLWPDQPEHQRLIGDIVRHLLPAAEHAGRFIGIDNGLSAISRHAKGLGYDAVILFLDEMILWLASHAADIHFLNREVPKVAKLVEAANADRPAPLVSFIARQRDLRELVGQVITGAANLGFTDLLRFWEGRFGTINLEDRNLSAIAEKRLLRPRSEDARRQIDEAFTKSTQTREELVATLLTKKGSKDDFRRLYPFSPALVETLVAVSSVLQRERTAIRIMLELLVQRRDNLELGELVAVGDLYDLIAEGDEAFTAEMRSHFEQAHKLYRTQLRPLLEEQCGLSFEEASGRPWNDPDRRKLRNDDRLVKTLLLSALAPEVESLRALTPVRLAALNHGSIQSPIAGQEGQMVLRKVRDWAGRIGQVKIQEGGPTPVISLQLSAVDIDAILERADSENNHGSRMRLFTKALQSSLGAQSTGEFTDIHKFRWRGTDRTCEIRFVNVCEIGDEMFDNPGSDWKVLIDYPFDRTGRTVRDDLAKIEDYRSRRKDQARTLVWLPSFFGEQAQRDLGRLVCLEHVLSEHRFSGFVSHLTDIQRAEARTIMENQRSALNSKLAGWLRIAYGLDEQNGADVLDPGQILEGVEHFQSLRGEMVSRVPAGPSIDQALGQWLDQALTSQFPAHPLFDDSLSVARSKIQKVLDVCRRAAETSNGRAEVEGNDRALMRQLTGPLDLGVMHETAWVQSERWKLHFLQQEAMHGGPLDVGALRRAIDIPKPMGLPPIIQDLLILTFAAQTNRAIIRHHTPIPAEPGELRNEDLLRQETLPSPEIWERARSMAAEIFGIAQLPALPTAKAVSQFVAAVQTWLQERRASAALTDLQSALIPHLANFGVEPENSARHNTARETAKWLRGLAQSDGCEFVELVAGAQFSSAPAAIARGLTTAASTAAALNSGHWAQEIEFARQLGGTASDEAAQIRQTVAGALRHDELVQSLAAVLNDAGKQARELIFKAATTGSQKPPPPAPVPDPSVDSIHVPVPDPTPARRTARSTSEVKGDALPAWLPREAARDLLKEVQLGEGGRRFAVTPLVARMLEMDPQASLSPDGLTLLLPKWDLHLPLEETNR